MAKKPSRIDSSSGRTHSLSKLAQRVSRCAELHDIKLAAFRAHHNLSDIVSMPFVINAGIDSDAKVRRDDTNGIDYLVAPVAIKMSASYPAKAEVAGTLEIEVLHILTVRMNSLNNLDQRHFDAYAETNCVQMAWPYIRELVHSTTMKMGLVPGIRLPILQSDNVPTSDHPDIKEVNPKRKAAARKKKTRRK